MREDFIGQKLCIFISKDDTYEGIILYELLLEFAFNSRLSGGMVTIGDQGFISAHDESAKHKLLRSSKNPPVLLEFQGRKDRIDRYVERIQPFIKSGLLTRTDVQITKFISSDEKPSDFEEELNEDQEQIFDVPTEEDTSPEFQEPISEVEAEQFEQQNLNEENEQEFDESDVNDSSPEFQEPEPEVESEADETEPEENEFIEPDAPEFEVGESDQPEGDDVEDESSQFIEEDEEDEPLLQLSENSETQPEEEIEDDFDLDDPLDILEELSDEPESKDLTDDEVDKLFDEDIKEFESSFESMLNKTKKARKSELESEAAEDVKVEQDDVEPPENEVGEDVSKDSDSVDKNHTDDEMKKYFSSMFIK